MRNKSIVLASEDRIYLEKLSETIVSLKAAKDALLFAQKMMPLSVALSRFDQDTISYPGIDANTRDPTYFIAAYSDTKNLDDALWVYRVVRSLTRYVLLSDRFYETGIDRNAILADRLLQSANKELLSGPEAIHVKQSIPYWLRQFAAFWDFEQAMKRRMLSNHSFAFAEIRDFNLSKASDASLIYARILGAKLPTFNENVALILHYNQALLDILDDWNDIEDDLFQDMPNVIVMAAVQDIAYNKIRKSRSEKIRKVILSQSGSSVVVMRRLVDEYHSAVKCVAVPENFDFLKTLSECYYNTLIQTMSSQVT